MKRLVEKACRSERNRAGTAMVEFALGAGVLIAVFSGTFQFGYTFYQYNALGTVVNDGARYASLRPYDSTTTTPSNGFLSAVRNMVVYGNPAGGSTPIVPGLTTSNVNLSMAFLNGVPSAVTVYIDGYVINSVFAQTTCTKKPQVQYRYLGIYSPY